MSFKKNFLKNGIGTFVQKLVRILEQIVLVPFFISSWGAAYYGEWLTLTIIPATLAFSDFGLGSSAANKFILMYASGDKQGAANTSKCGIFIISLSVFFGIFISFISLFVLDYFNVFSKSLISREDAILSVLFLMIARIISFYQQLYEAYFRAARRASMGMNLASLYSLINILIGLLVLLIGKGVVVYALTNLVVALLFNPFYIWKAKQVLGLHKEYSGKIIRSEIKNIATNGLGYLLSPIWQSLYFEGTTFIVRVSLGPIAVTIFNTVRVVTRSVNQVYSMVGGSAFPEFQYEVGLKNMAKARKIFRLTFVLTIILAIFGMIFLYLFGPWFYEIWTQKALNPPATMWNFFIIGIAFNAIWCTSIMTFLAFNLPYKFTIAGLIASVISLICTYFLANSFGLTGVAIGSVILDFILALYVLPVSCKILGQNLRNFHLDCWIDITDVAKKINLKSLRI